MRSRNLLICNSHIKIVSSGYDDKNRGVGVEQYEQLLTCVFRRKYFRSMKFESLAKHLSRRFHRLRWLLVANRTRLVSIAHALGAFKAKDLMAAGDKHRVRFLLAAVVAVALSLRLVSVRVQ